MRSVTVAASFGVANGRFARVNPLVPFSGPGETFVSQSDANTWVSGAHAVASAGVATARHAA